MKFIQSVQNEKVKAWKKLLTKKGRDKAGEFLVEGFHLVEEALKANAVTAIIKAEEIDLPSGWNVDNIELYNTTDTVAKELADTETPQRIFAVCQKRIGECLAAGKILLLDGVQDPGNIGTIIRTADAAGVELIVLGDGCVDVYNSKSVRSTQGSIFHLPIRKEKLPTYIQQLKQDGIKVFGTSLHHAVDYREATNAGRYALVVGNEGNGVSEEVLRLCDQNLYIPIHGKAESLNVAVATGVLLYSL
ncbi:MAG: TrmH family RNA methyltransferase [Bacillus sp. (in: firmicutes)]